MSNVSPVIFLARRQPGHKATFCVSGPERHAAQIDSCLEPCGQKLSSGDDRPRIYAAQSTSLITSNIACRSCALAVQERWWHGPYKMIGSAARSITSTSNRVNGTTMRHYVLRCRKFMPMLRRRARSKTDLQPTHVNALRCAFSHNGTTELQARHDWSRALLAGFHLTLTSPKPFSHMTIIAYSDESKTRRDVRIQRDVQLLCHALVNGTRPRFDSTQRNRTVQRNLARLIGIERRRDLPNYSA